MEEPARKLLVLDLDETLVYATKQPLEREPDFRVARYYVYKRPFLAEFLAYAFAYFDVAVWTAASRDYASAIVQEILPPDSALVFFWASERCSRAYDYNLCEHYVRKPFVKPWRRYRVYGRGSIIAVDDTPQKWEQSYGNLVTVREWVGDASDDELRLLIIYLESLREHPDVRTLEKRGWRTEIDNNERGT